MSSSTSSSSTLMSSPLFTPRFVPHRMVWKNEDDVCYECIDRESYASVVVRLRKFETTNMESYLATIEKAKNEAIKHECIANLVEILIDEKMKVSITVSENPRGITFMKYVETFGSSNEFNAELQQILLDLTELFKLLNESGKDFCAIPLQHLIMVKNGDKLESMKIRRPFLSALTKRGRLSPYNRFPNSNPSFVDIASIAFYAFTKQNLFDLENLDNAFNLLEPQQRTLINQLLNAASFEAGLNVIQKMQPSSDSTVEIITPSECDENTSDTSSFGVCDDEEEDGEIKDVDANSDSDYDIVKSMKDDDEDVRTAIGKEDEDDLKTAIGNDEDDEVKTAVEDEFDEIKTAIGKEDDDDETKTAIEDEYDEIRTAIEEEVDELMTAVCDDEVEIQTAIGDDDDEICTAISKEDADEIQTAFEDDDETKTAVEDESDETKTAIETEDDEVKTGISAEDSYELTTSVDDDFTDCILAPIKKVNDDFGLHIPNLDKVFKCHPEFKLVNATLEIEGNALVYKRQFSSVTYRKLVVYCENNEITSVTYEYCYGSEVHGKCNNSVTYKRFADMCPDANFCLMEVYIAVANALAAQPLYTFKNYGIDGLTVKFYANKKIHCEFDDQFILLNSEGQVLVASDVQDKMPAFEFLQNIIADLSKMSENFEKTSNKKFTITFTEQ